MHVTEDQIIGHVLGGEDDDAEAAAHVQVCPECRTVADEYRLVLELSRDVPGPPPGYAEKMWESVRWRLPKRPVPLLRRPWFLTAAASVSVAVIAASLVWRASQTPALGPPVPRAQIAHVQRAESRPEPLVVPAAPAVRPSLKRNVPQPPGRTIVPADAMPSKTPTREEILAGRDATRIFELALDEKDVEKKKEAIRALASLGNNDAGMSLVVLYADERDPVMRRFILGGIAMQHDPVLLKTVAKMDRDMNVPIPAGYTLGHNPFAGSGDFHIGHADITVTPKPDTAETTTAPPKQRKPQ